jgi:hypothetical protein
LQIIRLQHFRYLAVHLIQFAIGGSVCFIEAIFHGYGDRNVPAGRARGVEVLGSGDGVATNEGCEQEQPRADKSDHGRTITEPSPADPKAHRFLLVRPDFVSAREAELSICAVVRFKCV